MKHSFLVILAITILLSGSCSRKTVVVAQSKQNNPVVMKNNALPPCIIYKTTGDYSMQVPVAMSADKSRITSFPDVRDVFINDDYTLPTKLDNGFLLDNRGIGPDVAFLDYTYEIYHQLGKTPTADQLMKHILDKNPLTEMYQCGNKSQYKDLPVELNAQIHSGLKNCKKLK